MPTLVWRYLTALLYYRTSQGVWPWRRPCKPCPMTA